jgi:hypothetical protein
MVWPGGLSACIDNSSALTDQKMWERSLDTARIQHLDSSLLLTALDALPLPLIFAERPFLAAGDD